jgi:hypothetical protein
MRSGDTNLRRLLASLMTRKNPFRFLFRRLAKEWAGRMIDPATVPFYVAFFLLGFYFVMRGGFLHMIKQLIGLLDSGPGHFWASWASYCDSGYALDRSVLFFSPCLVTL